MLLTIYLLPIFFLLSEAFQFPLILSKYLYTELKDDDHLAIDDRTKRNATMCEEDHLLLKLAKLGAISPERIVQLVVINTKGLNTCHEINESIYSINREFKNCTALSAADNLYQKLFNGLSTANKLFCQNIKMKNQIQGKQNCLNSLKEEFVDCEGPADWFEQTNQTAVCQFFNSIIHCNYIKTAQTCGAITSKALKSLSINIFNAVISCNCDKSAKMSSSGSIVHANNLWQVCTFTLLLYIKFFTNVFGFKF